MSRPELIRIRPAVVIAAVALAAALSILVDPVIAIAGTVALGVGWLGLTRPHLLVLGTFGAILFDRIGVTGAKVAQLPITASKLAVLGSIGLWGVHVGLTHRPLFRTHPVLGAMVGMTLVTALTVTFSGNFDTGRYIVFGMGMVTVLTALAYIILAEQDLRGLYRVLSVLLLAAMGASLLSGAASQSGRATGTFGDPNEWATLILMVTPILLGGLATDPAPRARGLRMALVGLAPLAVLASGSRSALAIGIVVGIGSLWLLRQHRRELGACLLAGLVAAPFVIGTSRAIGRFERLLARLTGRGMVEDGSLDERGELLRQGIDLFYEHWLLGVGPGNFARATGFISLEGRMRRAHNTYLEVACEQGLFGILAGVIFLCTVARTLQHALAVAPDDLHRSRVYGLALGLFSVAAMSATLGLLTFSMTYLMLGLALAVTDQAHDAAATTPPSQTSAAQSMLSAVRVPREHAR